MNSITKVRGRLTTELLKVGEVRLNSEGSFKHKDGILALLCVREGYIPDRDIFESKELEANLCLHDQERHLRVWCKKNVSRDHVGLCKLF